MNALQHQIISTNGIKMHVVSAGPESGRLLIFLHGFPEFWYGWRKQIGFFANLGYRVLAPDQRGYNLSDKPKDLSAYHLDELAKDIVGLIDAAGREQALIVGHDWGAAVAWWLGVKHASRVEKLAVLNAPHPKIMRQHLFHNAAQRRKSWYIFFFQLPWLPEWRLAKDNWVIGVRALTKTSRPGTFAEADLVQYRAAWSQPGAATGMINWYRAALRRQPKLSGPAAIRVPTLLLWGARDRFLGREMAQSSVALCERGRLVMSEEASHWIQHEEAEKVNALLREFFDEVVC